MRKRAIDTFIIMYTQLHGTLWSIHEVISLQKADIFIVSISKYKLWRGKTQKPHEWLLWVQDAIEEVKRRGYFNLDSEKGFSQCWRNKAYTKKKQQQQLTV